MKKKTRGSRSATTGRSLGVFTFTPEAQTISPQYPDTPAWRPQLRKKDCRATKTRCRRTLLTLLLRPQRPSDSWTRRTRCLRVGRVLGCSRRASLAEQHHRRRSAQKRFYAWMLVLLHSMRWRTLLVVSAVDYLCLLTLPLRQRSSRRCWPCCHLLHGLGPLCWRRPRQAVMSCCMRRGIMLLRLRCHQGSCGC